MFLALKVTVGVILHDYDFHLFMRKEQCKLPVVGLLVCVNTAGTGDTAILQEGIVFICFLISRSGSVGFALGLILAGFICPTETTFVLSNLQESNMYKPSPNTNEMIVIEISVGCFEKQRNKDLPYLIFNGRHVANQHLNGIKILQRHELQLAVGVQCSISPNSTTFEFQPKAYKVEQMWTRVSVFP